jgi:hypothetical protein
MLLKLSFFCHLFYFCKCLQVLFGAIQSAEDHGYKVDIGVPGIQAFMPKQEASQQGTLTYKS